MNLASGLWWFRVLAFVTISLDISAPQACAEQGKFAPCRINVVERGSGWPVPLVELRTTHNVRFVSDNAGVIAMDLPELMGVESWFAVEGHGYEVKPDGFGYRGVKITPTPGGNLTVEVERVLPAKRLGRITGGGLFGESQQLGLEADWHEQGILGCDTVQTAVHNGQLFWAWGDTTLANHPLGLFDMTGATTKLRPLARFEPPVRLRYNYFTNDEGRPRVVAPMPGSGPTWMSGTISLPDESGEQKLVGAYEKIAPPLSAYQTGLCVWDEAAHRFNPYKVLWSKADGPRHPAPYPSGHPVLWTDEAGQEWALFGDPFPHLRCEATFEAWSDPQRWQLLKPQESVPTASGGKQIRPHRGSIAYSRFRKKWVAIFTQLGGEASSLGEIWYAEAEQPAGPWAGARQVVTHNKYTFYNPHLHPEFTDDDSPIVLFEGTYTKTFAGNGEATPRYEYNQVLYRLDLDDPALGLASE